MSRLPLLFSIITILYGADALAQTADPHAGHSAAPTAQKESTPAASAVSEKTKAAPSHDPHAAHDMPSPSTKASDPHAGHEMPPPTRSPDPHAGHAMPDAASSRRAGEIKTGAQQTVGDAPAPPPIGDHAADRVFGAAPMSRARQALVAEHGTTLISTVMINFAEYQSGPGGGYRWDGAAWYGGDVNRFVLRFEGDGTGEEGVEAAEVQALYSRAIARYTDIQVGIRHDFEPGPQRTYATLGFQTLLPYWFDVEGLAFLSNRGDLIGRFEAKYDLQLTQRFVLQPQAELRWAAQDIPEIGTGSGITHLELGLRLRYEIRREFAPYIGVAYERTLGRTTDFARARGDRVSSTRFVAGIRAWY